MRRELSILYLVTEDWYFCLHRLPIARAARDAGFRVLVATQVDAHGEVIEKEGFELIPMRWQRGSLNPFHALSELRQIVAIYRNRQPDLVHHVALKPSLLGSVASVIAGRSPVVNNLAGLGQAFSAQGISARAIRTILVAAFKVLFRRLNIWTIVANSDDLAFLSDKVGLAPGFVTLIRGIGVDQKRYVPEAGPVPDASACGRAITATDAPVCREFVKHDHNGFLVPPCGSRAIADSTTQMASDPASRKRIGAAGRKLDYMRISSRC